MVEIGSPVDLLYKTRIVQPQEQREQIEQQKETQDTRREPLPIESTGGDPSPILEKHLEVEQEQIKDTPIKPEEYQKDEYIVPAMDTLKSQGITPKTFKDYEYVEVGGRRFYSSNPGSWNAMVDYMSKYQGQTVMYTKGKEIQTYKKTGIVPEYIQDQISFPEGHEYKPLETEYERLAYEQHLGLKTG